MQQTAIPLSTPRRLTPLFALLLLGALAAGQASAANPCAAYPGVCHYTWDPVNRCCLSDPRFDCYDVCFASAASPALPWENGPATPSRPAVASPAGSAAGAPAAAASVAPSGQR